MTNTGSQGTNSGGGRRSIVRNTGWNLAGALFPTLISLIVLPFFLREIGLERYGILSIALVILGNFGLFDLGLGRATAQRIARQVDASPEERSQTVWTALLLNIAFGCVGMLIIGPAAALYFDRFMDLDPPLDYEARMAAFWLSAALPVAMLSGVLTGALQGRSYFAALNIVNIFSTLAMQVLPLFAAIFLSASLSVVLPAVVLARVLAIVALFVICIRAVPIGVPRLPSKNQAMEMLSFGGWVSVSSFVGPILDSLERMVIGSVAGAAAVSYFSVPMSLLRRGRIVPMALSNALFPRLAESVTSEERDRLTVKSLAVLVSILPPPFIVGGVLLAPFLTWWIGPDFSINAAPVGQALMVGVWLNGLAVLPVSHLQAQGRPDIVAKCHLAELVPFLILLYVLVQAYGVLGAAIAWSLRSGIDALVLFGFSIQSPRMLLRYLFVPTILLVTSTVLLIGLDMQNEWVQLLLALCFFLSVLNAYLSVPRDLVLKLISHFAPLGKS